MGHDCRIHCSRPVIAPRCRGCLETPDILPRQPQYFLTPFVSPISHPLSVTSSVLSVFRRYSAHGKSAGTLAEFRLRNLFSRRYPEISPASCPIDVGIDFRETLSRKNQNVWRKRYEKKESFESFVVKERG